MRSNPSILMPPLESMSISGRLMSYLGGLISSNRNMSSIPINVWMDQFMLSLYLLDSKMRNIPLRRSVLIIYSQEIDDGGWSWELTWPGFLFLAVLVGRLLHDTHHVGRVAIIAHRNYGGGGSGVLGYEYPNRVVFIHLVDPLGRPLVLLWLAPVPSLDYIITLVLGLDTLLGYGGEIIAIKFP